MGEASHSEALPVPRVHKRQDYLQDGPRGVDVPRLAQKIGDCGKKGLQRGVFYGLAAPDGPPKDPDGKSKARAHRDNRKMGNASG